MATQPSDSAKQRSRSSPSDELAVIAQRAQAFTNASGAAIALSEGVEDEIVCRARSGASAPDIGASLRVEGSFTGICIQTGKELRCDDAEGLITTGGGAGGAVAAATGFGMATGGSGLSVPSSRARRSFCNKAPIWSAMVLSTATWVMVKA